MRRPPARLAAALGPVLVLCGALGTPAGAATDGTWAVAATPANVRAAHVALMHTGEVLLIAGSGNNEASFNAGSFKTSIWNPQTGALRSVATPWDAFCAGHAFMPDGKLLVAGGTTAYASPATNGNLAGDDAAYLFDPVTEQYQAVPNMHDARWYPTVTGLGDGRQLVIGGLDEAGDYTSGYEIFDGTSWSTVKAGPSPYVYQPMYPAMHLMRDGRLFYSGVNTFGSNAAEVPPGLWNLSTNSYQRVDGLTHDRLRDQGASVLLPPAQDQRVMVIGGGDHSHNANAVSSTAIADLKSPNPAFIPGPPIDAAKMYVSTVTLPDSTVLQTGGAAKSVEFNGTAVRSTQIFNPKTNVWTKVATPAVDRLYHSSAILLPDGRVATFGSNPLNSFEMRIEVFTPPYLETGTPRPVITSAPSELHYGDYAALGTTQSASITAAALVRPAATTHSSDPNQRLVKLSLKRTATGVSITMPTEPNLAPAGWYMLFVVDANGVPSVAKWVHLQGSGVKPKGGYALDGFGGLHRLTVAGQAAPAVSKGPYWPGWDIARGVTRRADAKTGYVLDGFGGLHGFTTGTAAMPPKPTGAPYWSGWDIARGVALLPSGTGGYVLDGFGGLHRFKIGSGPTPPAVTGAPYWPGFDLARGITILPDGSGGYVLDAFGRLHPFRIGSGGPAVPSVSTPYRPGAPVRGVAVQPNSAAGYVADGFGGVHPFAIAGGVAHSVTGAPSWPGWAIGRGIAI